MDINASVARDLPWRALVLGSLTVASIASVAFAASPNVPAAAGYVIHNGESGHCLGVHGGSTARGAAIVAGRCTSDATQLWYAVATTRIGKATYYQYRNGHSGLCLGVQGNSARSTQMIQESCGGTSDHSQFWRNAYIGSPEDKPRFYNFINGHSGMCMGIHGSNIGGNVVQGVCADTPTQTWYTSEGFARSGPGQEKLDTAFDTSHRGQLLHDLRAHRSEVTSNKSFLPHNMEDALNVVISYDSLITYLSRSLGIRKALIQSEVFWEYWKETYADDPADVAVQSWYAYQEAFEAWKSFPLGRSPTPPIGGRDDSSTGISQIHARTAIRARNWAIAHHLISGKLLNAGDWHDMEKVWNQLHDDGTYNISTVPLVLLEGASEVGVTGIRLNYSPRELKAIFARYNGTGPDAAHYGVELYSIYTIFDRYNALSR